MVFDYNRFMFVRGNPLKYTDPTGHDPQCEVGTSACDAEWTLWRQYMQTEDAWSSWEDFLQGYSNYMSYASSPDTYLQDWLVRAGLADGDWQTSAQRLALAENFSTAVLGEGIPYFFNPDTPLETLYLLAESGESSALGATPFGSVFIVSPRGTAVSQTTAQQWHQGTFSNVVDSMEYHLLKHGKGRTIDQYTADAVTFYNNNRSSGSSVTLKDGTSGLRIQTGAGKSRVGGYWTTFHKIVTFWD